MGLDFTQLYRFRGYENPSSSLPANYEYSSISAIFCLATPLCLLFASPVTLRYTNKSIWTPLVSIGKDLYMGDLPYIHIYVLFLCYLHGLGYDGLMFCWFMSG